MTRGILPSTAINLAYFAPVPRGFFVHEHREKNHMGSAARTADSVC